MVEQPHWSGQVRPSSEAAQGRLAVHASWMQLVHARVTTSPPLCHELWPSTDTVKAAQTQSCHTSAQETVALSYKASLQLCT